jgi:hypothetical protein
MHNDFIHNSGNHLSHHAEPGRTGANSYEQEWMSVEKAVVYCAELGLTRTPKTIRKWAERSSGLPDGDVHARKEDTPWGYRWQIERASLTRKVEEEIEMRGANSFEHVQASAANLNAAEVEKISPIGDEPQSNRPEPIHTGSGKFAPSSAQMRQETSGEPGANQCEPVQRRSELETVLDEVRARISDKDQEIRFLRDQLADAQVEIGRRAASTDEALKTIDRVVRSFEMQAEANKALALRGGAPTEYREATQQMRFTPESIDNQNRHQDIRRV